MEQYNSLMLLMVVLAVTTKAISHPTSSSSEADDESFSSRLGKAAEQDSLPSRQSATRQFSVAIPELQQTQYQVANDEAGTYSYGYAYPDQMHTESRSSDGQVTGSYFYKDPNGHTNKVQYRADASGFRVMTNNIPPAGLQAVHDTPEVAEARRKHLETWQAIAQFNSKASTAQAQQQQQDTSADAIAVAQPAAVEPEQIYVAPLDIEPVPAAFRIDPEDNISPIVEQEQTVEPIVAVALPVAEPLTALSSRSEDDFIDDSKQAVITDDGTASDNMQQVVFGANHPVSDIEVNVEPIKLLAQLYAKHLKQNSDAQVPVEIERPQGFHPTNLQPVSQGFDLFSRSEGDDRQAVEVSNPEFIDLRAFLLTNRFREALQDHLKSAASSSHPYADLSLSDEMDPSDDGSSTSIMQQGTYVPQDLYNYYYNTLVEAGFKPVYVKDESPDDKIPLSLKLAALGFTGGSVDGQHTAQVPSLKPYSNSNYKNNNNNNYFYSSSPSSTYYNHPYYQRMYSQYYSPYYNYYYRSNPYLSSPYSHYSYPYYSY